MLEEIRQSTKSGWTYLLVGLLIIVFAVFFGVPGDACGGSANTRRLVAEVNGENIHTDDVGVVFNRWFGGQRRVDDSQLKQQEAQALRALLLTHLLADKAKDHGLRVSDEELVSYLKDPLKNAEYRQVYGREGGFDGPLYKAYIQNQLRLSIPHYEDFKRNELLAFKYLNLVEMQFQATPWEIKDLDALRNTKVDLEFAQFDPEALADYVPVTDEEVAAFEIASLADIQKYYDDNKADYETPARVLLRRIFIIKPEESEGEDKVKTAIEKWDKATTSVKEKPESFADVAGEISDSEKETQGLMEWTTLENLDQNIASKVRDLKKGETAEIDTEYAFMLVKIEDRTEAAKTALDEVKTDIARKLLQEQKSKTLIDGMVTELRTAMADKETLSAAITALKTTALEDQEAPVEGEEPAKSSWDAVTIDNTGEFSLEGQDMSAMFGGQFAGMSSRTPWDRIPKIGQNADLARDAFKELTTEKPLAAKPYKTNGKYYFVRLANRIEPGAEVPKTDDEKNEGEDTAPADPEAPLEAEIRTQKIRSTLGAYAMVMSVPSNDYGPFLENMLNQGIDSGKVKLYERNFDAIPLVRSDDGEESAAPTNLAKPKEEGS